MCHGRRQASPIAPSRSRGQDRHCFGGSHTDMCWSRFVPRLPDPDCQDHNLAGPEPSCCTPGSVCMAGHLRRRSTRLFMWPRWPLIENVVGRLLPRLDLVGDPRSRAGQRDVFHYLWKVSRWRCSGRRPGPGIRLVAKDGPQVVRAGRSPEGDRYSKRTLPGAVMRRSSGSVTVMTPNATARPMPISA
jgi:hypothetical protein